MPKKKFERTNVKEIKASSSAGIKVPKKYLEGPEKKSEQYIELYKEYKRLAKQADQRMVRLEKLVKDDYFASVGKYAYKKAKHDISKYTGVEDSARWNTAAPDNYMTLLGKVNRIKYFLESPSSTKNGIVDIYQQKADKINEQYGTNFSWKSFADFFESENADNLSETTFGSETTMIAMKILHQSSPEAIEKMKNAESRADAMANMSEPIREAITKWINTDKIDKFYEMGHTK